MCPMDFLYRSLCLKGLKCKGKAAEVLDMSSVLWLETKCPGSHKILPNCFASPHFSPFSLMKAMNFLQPQTFCQHVMHHRAPQSYLRLFGPSCNVNSLHHWDSLTGFRVSLCNSKFPVKYNLFPKASGIRADIT